MHSPAAPHRFQSAQVDSFLDFWRGGQSAFLAFASEPEQRTADREVALICGLTHASSHVRCCSAD
jgi:hypothetical protein